MLRELSQILGKYVACLGLVLLLPLFSAIYYELAEPQSLYPNSMMAFLYAICIAFALSAILLLWGRKASGHIGRRESILLVALIWVITSFISALPFYFSKTLNNPVDAYFEAMSGLTTTGSTLLSAKAYAPGTDQEIPIHYTNVQVPKQTYTYYGTVAPIHNPETGEVLYSGIEAVARPILLWRSFLQWGGGMGIIAIFLTVLPALGVGGKFLYQIEVTGPFKEDISPRIHETVSQLWKLYLFFTIAEIILLLWADDTMPFFDSVCLAFSNISTGGFSIRNDSIASYQNDIVRWIILGFMILGSINFALYFHIIRMKIQRLYVPDFFLFISIVILGGMAVSGLLIGQPHASLTGESSVYSTANAFKDGIFQAVSLQTSTGYTTSNYDLWPYSAQMVLLLLMYVGGMSGSTAGGIKTSRFYILYKIVLHRLELLYRQDSIRKLRIGPAEVDDSHALTALGFFCIAAVVTVVGTAIFILRGIDPETSLGLTACFTNNTGTSFRAGGPASSLCFLPDFEKILSTFWMLLGRLEYYVILLLLLPSYWKGR
jgi:trk system potassium uptake protein TrkH